MLIGRPGFGKTKSVLLLFFFLVEKCFYPSKIDIFWDFSLILFGTCFFIAKCGFLAISPGELGSDAVRATNQRYDNKDRRTEHEEDLWNIVEEDAKLNGKALGNRSRRGLPNQRIRGPYHHRTIFKNWSSVIGYCFRKKNSE